MKLEELMMDYKDYEIKDKEALLKLLEKPKPKSVYDLEIGDEFRELCIDGTIISSVWHDDEYHRNVRDMGNIFLTEEEAEKEKAYRKCKELLKKYADGYEWKTGEHKHYMYAKRDCTDDWKLSINWNKELNNGVIYFSSQEEVEKAIEEIGEERLLRDYFRIPENEL